MSEVGSCPLAALGGVDAEAPALLVGAGSSAVTGGAGDRRRLHPVEGVPARTVTGEHGRHVGVRGDSPAPAPPPPGVTDREKGDVTDDRSAALLVRVWLEEGGEFRARVTAAGMHGAEDRTVALAASRGDVLDAVSAWLDEFLRYGTTTD